MKQYPKPLPNTSDNEQYPVVLRKKRFEETAKRATAGGFLIGGLLKPHIRNEKTEKADDFLDISFKEWEKWLNDRELKIAQLAYNYRSTFHPTDWSKLPPLTALQDKEATTDYDATNWQQTLLLRCLEMQPAQDNRIQYLPPLQTGPWPVPKRSAPRLLSLR